MTIPGHESDQPPDQPRGTPQVDVTWLTDSQPPSGEELFSGIHKLPALISVGIFARGLKSCLGDIDRSGCAAALNALGWAFRQPGEPFHDIAPGWVSTYDFNIEIRSTKVTSSGHSAWITFDSIFTAGRGPIKSWTCARWSTNNKLAMDGNRLEINDIKVHGGAEKSYRSC